ncbi:hypothetical protein H2200_009687 [Cladophialophora chaetospira]|uniref:Uncharacterized protein n=1 Tax=Cladophialophora chaetospira TaxID=386627 RepID=A0AA38X2V8_9EURO|nr:hypothetical protein H2200_009687 [Cladophialophora chaetospira]
MANIAFQGPNLAQSRHRVRQVEEFADQIAGGVPLTAIAHANWINIYQLNAAVTAFNNYSTRIDQLKAKRVPGKLPSHLNHLTAFTEQQSKDIKEQAIAKSMITGEDIEKVFLKLEFEIETAISAAIDYQLEAYGIRPTFNQDGSVEILC